MRFKKRVTLFCLLLTVVLSVAACTGGGKGSTISVSGVTGYADAVISSSAKTITLEASAETASFDLSAIKVSDGVSVSAFKDSGRTEAAASPLTLASGSNTFYLTFTLGELSENWTLNITRAQSEKTLVDIVIKSFVTGYQKNATFSGGKLSLLYSDGTEDEADITLDMLTGFDTSTVGKREVTVTYLGKTVKVEITVTEEAPPVQAESIAIKTLKTDYFVGDSFEPGTLTVKWTDGSETEVNLSLSLVTGFSTASKGLVTITITYEGLSIFRQINVEDVPQTDAVLESVAIKTFVTRYEVGAEFGGGRLLLNFDDDSSREIEITKAMLTGFDTSTVGKRTVTVTYEGKTDTVEITVSETAQEKTVKSIAIKSLKTNYYVGESFVPGILSLTWTDESVTDENLTISMVSGFDTSKAQTITITISYNGLKTTKEIVVASAPVSAVISYVRVKSLESVYYVGDPFVEGVLNVHYSDNTVKEVKITQSMVTGFSTAKVGKVTLTIAYNDHSTDYIVTVMSKIVETNPASKTEIKQFMASTMSKTAAIVGEALTYEDALDILENDEDYVSLIDALHVAAAAHGVTKADLDTLSGLTVSFVSTYNSIMTAIAEYDGEGDMITVALVNEFFDFYEELRYSVSSERAGILLSVMFEVTFRFQNSLSFNNAIDLATENGLNDVKSALNAQKKMTEHSYYLSVSLKQPTKELVAVYGEIYKVLDVLAAQNRAKLTKLANFALDMSFMQDPEALDYDEAIQHVHFLADILSDFHNTNISADAIDSAFRLLGIVNGAGPLDLESIFGKSIEVVLKDNLLVVSKLLKNLDAKTLETMLTLYLESMADEDGSASLKLIVHSSVILSKTLKGVSTAQKTAFINNIIKVLELGYDEIPDLVVALEMIDDIATFNPDSLTEAQIEKIMGLMMLTQDLVAKDSFELSTHYYFSGIAVLEKNATIDDLIDYLEFYQVYPVFYPMNSGYNQTTIPYSECTITGFDSSKSGYRTLKIKAKDTDITQEIELGYYIFDENSKSEFVLFASESYIDTTYVHAELNKELNKSAYLDYHLAFYNTEYDFSLTLKGRTSIAEIIGFDSSKAQRMDVLTYVQLEIFGKFYFDTVLNVYDPQDPQLTDWRFNTQSYDLVQNSEPDVLGYVEFQYNYGNSKGVRIDVTPDMIEGFSTAKLGQVKFTFEVEYENETYSFTELFTIVSEAEGWNIVDAWDAQDLIIFKGSNVSALDIVLTVRFSNGAYGHYTVRELQEISNRYGTSWKISTEGEVDGSNGYVHVDIDFGNGKGHSFEVRYSTVEFDSIQQVYVAGDLDLWEIDHIPTVAEIIQEFGDCKLVVETYGFGGVVTLNELVNAFDDVDIFLSNAHGNITLVFMSQTNDFIISLCYLTGAVIETASDIEEIRVNDRIILEYDRVPTEAEVLTALDGLMVIVFKKHYVGVEMPLSEILTLLGANCKINMSADRIYLNIKDGENWYGEILGELYVLNVDSLEDVTGLYLDEKYPLMFDAEPQLEDVLAQVQDRIIYVEHAFGTIEMTVSELVAKELGQFSLEIDFTSLTLHLTKDDTVFEIYVGNYIVKPAITIDEIAQISKNWKININFLSEPTFDEIFSKIKNEVVEIRTHEYVYYELTIANLAQLGLGVMSFEIVEDDRLTLTITDGDKSVISQLGYLFVFTINSVDEIGNIWVNERPVLEFANQPSKEELIELLGDIGILIATDKYSFEADINYLLGCGVDTQFVSNGDDLYLVLSDATDTYELYVTRIYVMNQKG